MIKNHTKDVSVSDVCTSMVSTQDNPVTMLLKIPGLFFNLVRVWYERATTRAALSHLDARFLEDVGLSAKQADTEARKSFWVK